MKSPLTIAELSPHLDYEIEMLNGTFGLFFTIEGIVTRGGASENQRKIMFDTNKESFCIHVRQLEEFFTKKTNSCAQALSGDKYSAAREPRFPVGKKKFSEKLNTQMAHLIYGRPASDDEKIQGKDFEHMFRWVDEELKRFKKAVTDSNLKVRDVDLTLIPADPAELGEGSK